MQNVLFYSIYLSNPTLYSTIIGSFKYLVVVYADIAYTAHVVSRFVSSLTTIHWTTILHSPSENSLLEFLFLAISSLQLHVNAIYDSDRI